MKLLIVPYLILGLFLPGASPARAQTGKTAHVSPGYREQDMLNAIKKLEDEMRIAVLKGDMSWWNANLSDEYSETGADGKVRNKAETLDMQKSKYLIYDTMNFSDRAVHTFNFDTVIVTGKVTMAGTNQGQNINGDFQFTRVWIRQGLEWKLASYQLTRTET